MKTKKLEKKLVLSKETVADLNVEAMTAVNGGVYAYTERPGTICGSDCLNCFPSRESKCCP
jgi:hypothetical protein